MFCFFFFCKINLLYWLCRDSNADIMSVIPSLWQRACAQTLVAKTKLSCCTFQHCSTTVSTENYPPPFILVYLQEAWNSAYRYFSLKNDTNNWWCKQNVLHRLQFKFDWEKKKSRWQEQKQKPERTRPKYFTVSLWVKRPQVVYKLIIIIIIIKNK